MGAPLRGQAFKRIMPLFLAFPTDAGHCVSTAHYNPPMPTFLIHFSLLDASPDDEKSLDANLVELGFSRNIISSNKLMYRLPPCSYHYSGELTKDQLMDRTKRIALRQRKSHCIVVTETVASAWVGLDLVGRDSTNEVTQPADIVLSRAEERALAAAPPSLDCDAAA